MTEAETNVPTAADAAREFYTILVGTENGQIAVKLRNALKRVDLNDVESGATPEQIECDANGLAALIVTDYNGHQELPQQQVEVVYLKREQTMRIPYGLNLNPTLPVAELPAHAHALRSRYWKIAGMPYATLREHVTRNVKGVALRNIIDALPEMQPQTSLAAFRPMLDADTEDHSDFVMSVYSVASMAMGLNYDVRDTGYLQLEEMRVKDTDWQTADRVPTSRFKCKLRAYTLKQTAALNLKACNGYALGGLMRAFGIAFGMLPAEGSAALREYIFTYHSATQPEISAITSFENSHADRVPQICANLLAVFGLLHLCKDHTFKSGDDNMTRITSAWLNTIRTITNTDLQGQILQNSEVIARTAPHPFGLASTYWAARVLYNQNRLASPLKVRYDTTPPPVQRVMIALAAKDSWATLPLGQVINHMLRKQINDVQLAVDEIRKCPPAYSGLARMYGIKTQLTVSPLAMSSANTVMPVAFGYAEAAFVSETKQKEGLALALSFKNVQRDMKAQTHMWEGLWTRYFSDMTKAGLAKFTEESMQIWDAIRTATEEAPPGPPPSASQPA